MLRGQKLPPATAFTVGDRLRLMTGILILVLGFVLLWRLWPLGLTPQMVLVSGAFIAFGVYRSRLGYTRWRDYAAGQRRGPVSRGSS